MNTITIKGIQAPSVEIDGASVLDRAIALSNSKAFTAVANASDAKAVGESLVELAGLIKVCEESRKLVKKPILELGKLIDDTAAKYSADLEFESKRLRGLVGSYNARVEEEQRAAERKRQEELARIERERIEAERKAQAEAARIERERIAAEAEARRVANLAFENARGLDAAEAAALAAEDAAKQIAAKAKRDAEAAEEARLLAERERNKQTAALTVAPKLAHITGVSTSSVWKFEVIDIGILCLHNPGLVEMTPKTREINAAIKAGHKAIPGLRIWEEKEVRVRA
jgi:hypothetical protein